MIRRERVTIEGKKVIEFIPETKADELELARMIDAGEITISGSFAEELEDKGQLSRN